MDCCTVVELVADGSLEEWEQQVDASVVVAVDKQMVNKVEHWTRVVG